MPSTEDTVCYRLPNITIDSTRLVADYERIADGTWTNQNRYRSDTTNWKGISLYSLNGESDDLRCSDRPITKKTPAGQQCPYICDELLTQFGAKPLRVAFYRLTANTSVGTHKDYGQNRTMGMVRIHIPVVTNEKVTMTVEDNQYFFDVGEAWYFDASCWHSVKNDWDQDRIHLIADFYPSPGLDKHLKPIMFNDRIRFMKAKAESYGAVTHAFFRFVKTKEGRQRIRNRLGVVLSRH